MCKRQASLLKTALSPAAKTWLNPKLRCYALQGGSSAIGQGAQQTAVTPQLVQPVSEEQTKNLIEVFMVCLQTN